MPAHVRAVVSCGPWLWYMTPTLFVRELQHELTAEEAQHVRAGFQIERRGRLARVRTKRMGWGVSNISPCATWETLSPSLLIKKEEGDTVQVTWPYKTPCPHKLSENTFSQGRHPAIYTPYSNNTPLPLRPGLSTSTHPADYTQPASQATGNHPLSPLRGLKPHCHGTGTPEHSGLQQSSYQLLDGFRGSRHDVTFLIYWCWGSDKREEG